MTVEGESPLKPLWPRVRPGVGLLVGGGGAQHRRLVAQPPDQLQADGQAVVGKAARDAGGGVPARLACMQKGENSQRGSISRPSMRSGSVPTANAVVAIVGSSHRS